MNEQPCIVCKKPTKAHCALCKKSFYCCKEHQKEDWPTHKLICNPNLDIPAEKIEEDKNIESIELAHEKFQKIVAKYELDKGDKADEIASLLSDTGPDKKITVEDFSAKYGMTIDEAFDFLTFIHIGVKFREKHLSSPNLVNSK